MGSERLPLHNDGIYHNLPTYDPSLQSLEVIVTGANGISGFATMRVLLQNPLRWSKIYALSRKPPPKEMLALLTSEQRSRIQHIAVDFLHSASEIADAMTSAGVQADHVFFYSYLQPKPDPAAQNSHAWSNADELEKVNTSLLQNFISALSLANIRPRRFLLQTGAKNYGVHIGRHRTPCCESDPQPKHLEPNFYYPQEEILFKFCRENNSAWNIICPAWIVGSVTSAQINGFHPFAVYAAVQARKGEQLHFPGDWRVWQDERFHATARLTGYLSEWCVLEPKCANQKFNAQDTAPLSWDRFWQELSRWYGVGQGVAPPESDEARYRTIVAGKGGEESPLGAGPPVEHRQSFSLVEWAKKAENRAAWVGIMADSNGRVTADPFVDPEGSFQMGDANLVEQGILNMSKARRLGWTGYVDTIESIFEMYKENAELGLVPRMVVERAEALV